MTAVHRSVDAAEPAFTSLLARVADGLAWSAGQVWTVAIGLAVAVPAAVFGLGPALDGLDDAGIALAAPPSSAQATPVASAPSEPPAILCHPPSPAAHSTPAPIRPASPDTGPAVPSRPQAAAAADPDGRFATVQGPGTIRALAAAADAVVVAIDAGEGAPGRIVVLDHTGEVVLDRALEIDGVAYERPGGVAVTDSGILVATAAPAAVVSVDPLAGTVAKVADVPDVPLCLPVATTTNCQSAVPDAAPVPQHLAVTEDGDIYVADRAQACIFHVGEGDELAAAWLCDLAFASFPAAPAGGLAGLAATSHRLVFTIAAGLDGRDRVAEVAIVDGAPGARRDLAEPASGAGTSGVAILPDGRAVVALANAGVLLVVEPDGSASRTITLPAMPGPVDVDATADTLVIAHRAAGTAGAVSERPVATL